MHRTTLSAPAVCAGIGLHTGARVRMVMKPASVGSGIVFERSDLDVADARVPARREFVRSTDLGTTLVNEAGASAATVEHLMAAFAGLGVDDVIVELDGPEVPAMDGSSAPFVDLMLQVSLTQSPAPRRAIQVLKTVEVEDGARSATFLPSVKPAIDVTIDFDDPTIGRQHFAFEVNRDAFSDLVAPARTFGFRRDLNMLLKNGLARGGSLDNAIVIDEGKVANPEGLRFADEFVRHKALDALGDLYLAGAPILGLYRATRPGHGLNAKAVEALLADETAWRWANMADAEQAEGLKVHS
ncbi:UDP-3-O-acyl-N-acetylglucosamine deacetylase [Maricaulaceae bacterium NA33B04]|nr:UDP-3-O-acyl-N-acetylglucosamine deacetylase [Maricaulaceae bacterium NA33B04]